MNRLFLAEIFLYALPLFYVWFGWTEWYDWTLGKFLGATAFSVIWYYSLKEIGKRRTFK